jgi:hypothetical protein
MSYACEQIVCNRHNTVKSIRHKDARWWQKHYTNKWRRRASKILLEDSPPYNRFRGWYY